ncbi:Predicted membrane protein [Isobaculum melis]|uniref:Predicted membrane protein n=2 Tax=Isobaculum melis TaxID=142588 RepID=A0A1H9S4S4_9LACT|nr:Predicted membrane protein [Isobaculum melis]
MFILVEALLLLGTLYDIFKNIPLLICAVIAVFLIFISLEKKRPRSNTSSFTLVLGSIMLIFVLLSTMFFWLFLGFGIVFFVKTTKRAFPKAGKKFKNAPWNKKELVVVETTESTEKNGKKFKRQWLGNQRIGDSIYEWDDINITIFAGDTIIDLGNTLLPKDDNVVLMRKGFGKTRILVPVGTGVMLEHTTLSGKVTFETQKFELQNESVKIYSEHYDENNRKLKIITNVLAGDIEVIFV